MSIYARSRAGVSLDFLENQNHPELLKVAAATPDLRGNIPDADEARFIPDEQFAIVAMEKGAKVRHFPTNSPAATEVSMACFEAAKDVFTKEAKVTIATNFDTACQWHGLKMPDHIRELLEETQNPGGIGFDGPVKTASAGDYALIVNHPDGKVARYYALPTHESVKTAAAYFEERVREFAPEHRRAFARGITKRAAELGVHDLEVGPELEKYAADTFGSRWPNAIEVRVRKLGEDHRASESYEKLAAAIGSGNVDLPTAADFMAKLDKLAGINRDAFADLAEGQQKTGASAYSEEVDGEIVTGEMLDKLVKGDKIASLYGQSFAREFSKRPVEIFASLPLDDKRVMKEALYGRA